jgi:tRNA C32,U32 (ribose-2'-O)-methylase TrmJ
MRADLRPLAAELVGRSAAGPVALLFGSEQTGLSNAAFDRCDIVLSLPTDPGYPSLNLAQAALLLLYELRQAAAAGGMPDRASRARVVSGELDALCASVASALRAIRFVKSGDGTAVLRRLRALIQRAEPDTAEVALLAAIAREVTKVGERSEI